MTEIINVFRNGKNYRYNLPNELDKYIKDKNHDYLQEIQENNFIIYPGRKLELITAYKNNALIYKDVPDKVKIKYELSYRDEGIDVIKLNSKMEITEVFQCKDFKGYVSDHHLGTFYGILYKNRNLRNVKAICVGSLNTKFKKDTLNITQYDLNEFDNFNLQQIFEDDKYSPQFYSKTDLDLDLFTENNSITNSKTDIDIKYKKQQDHIQYHYLKQYDLILPKKVEQKPFKQELRYYQKEAIEKINQAMLNKDEEINIKIPCGCGKTQIIYHFAQLDYKILIVVPRVAIAEQIEDYFITKLNKRINTEWQNHRHDNNSNVTLAVYKSVEEHINKKKLSYDILFVDEAHNIIGSELYRRYHIENVTTDSKHVLAIKTKFRVNLSATIDIKKQGRDYEFEYDKAVKEGFICPYEIHLCYNQYFDEIISKRNNNAELTIANSKQIEEQIRNKSRQYKTLEILKNNLYEHVIIYCNNKDTAKELNNFLNENRIKSKFIISEVSMTERTQILNDFRKGKFRVLCAVECISEGTDLPIADTAIFFNDRSSKINIIQSVGRVLRLHNYKNVGKVILISEQSQSNRADKIINNYIKALEEYDEGFKSRSMTFNFNNRSYTSTAKDIINESNNYDELIRHRADNERMLNLCREYANEQECKDKLKPSPERKYKNEMIGRFVEKYEKRDYDNRIRKELEHIFINITYAHVNNLETEIDLYIDFYRKNHCLPYKQTYESSWVLIHKYFNKRIEEKNKRVIQRLTKEIPHCLFCNDKLYLFNDVLEVFNNYINCDMNVEEIKIIILTIIRIEKYKYFILLEHKLQVSILRIINLILINEQNILVSNSINKPFLNLHIIKIQRINNDMILYDELGQKYRTRSKLINSLSTDLSIRNTIRVITNANKNGHNCYQIQKNNLIINRDSTIKLEQIYNLKNIPENNIRLYNMINYNILIGTEFEDIFKPLYAKIYTEENRLVNIKNIFINEYILQSNILEKLYRDLLNENITILRQNLLPNISKFIKFVFILLKNLFEYYINVMCSDEINNLNNFRDNVYELIIKYSYNSLKLFNVPLVHSLIQSNVLNKSLSFIDIIRYYINNNNRKFYNLCIQNNVLEWIEIFDLITKI